MNKRMKELLKKMKAKLAEIKDLGEDESEKAATLLDEVDELERAYNNEKRAYETEKRFAALGTDENNGANEGEGAEEKNFSGFGVIAKLLRNQQLTEDEIKMITPQNTVEKALISGASASQGENYLIPEDVRNEIHELRRRYISAKQLCTVIPTMSLTGSVVFESGTPTGLVAFTDGGEISSTGGEPTFEQKTWTIGFYGKIIPVSNILTGTEKAGLLAYLNKWFIKNAVLTENTAIFNSLKAGKTAVELTGWESLKTSINTGIDPDCKIDGVIVTNQNGFNYLDTEKDADNRPILQPNPSDATKFVFQSMPVIVFPNSQLADVEGKHPFFYGRTADGCWFMELMGLMFAESAHAGFSKNQTHLRVIEGFAVTGADKEAYEYGLMAAPVTPPEG